MSYKIAIRVYQTNPDVFFTIVEKTVWYFAGPGSWSECKGEHILTMGGSGTSGTLRFVADNGENFIVVVGVHDYKRWCDIVADLTNGQTGIVINPEYYGNTARATARQQQLSSFNVCNSKGRKIMVKYTVADGTDLVANVIIG